VGQLMDGSADVTAAGLSITEERDLAVDFTLAVVQDIGTLTVVKNEVSPYFPNVHDTRFLVQKSSVNTTALLRVFTQLSWFCVFFILLGCLLALSIQTLAFSRSDFNYRHVGNHLSFIYLCLLQQVFQHTHSKTCMECRSGPV